MLKILVLNGPNLHYLGRRQQSIYGSQTLAEINELLLAKAKELEIDLSIKQSNSESYLIDALYQAEQENINMILLNPAAFTHTSIALRDALLAVNIPFIEVHLSNIYSREDFRKVSFFNDIAVGTVAGFGSDSYLLALLAAYNYLQSTVGI